MKSLRLPLLALLLLSACGTPQEQCIANSTRDLRVVQDLIDEAEANLARGYAYEEVTVYRPDFVDCTPDPTEANPTPAPEMCLVEVPETSRKPVAIDLNAEAAKLASLKQKEAQLLRDAEAVVAACKAKYPEE